MPSRQQQVSRRPQSLAAQRQAQVAETVRAPGRALETGTRAAMEARFAHDFSQVRVHTGPLAAASAAQLNARAYTVGRDVVFAAGQMTADASGRRLLAHELAHVVQQGGGRHGARLQGKLGVSQPGERHEREADAAAARVMAGRPVGSLLTPVGPVIQREGPAPGAPAPAAEEKKEPGEVIAEGLKVVAEQASDNNPRLKEKVIEPLKLKLKGGWDQLGTGAKVGVVGVGGAALGIGAGSLLSDPKGRKQLEGLNLAAPFTLIPYMPLTSFKYTLPSGETPELRQVKFDTSFDASELIKLGSKRDIKLKVNMEWGYDPSTDKLKILGGDATLVLLPGLTISAGVYKDVLKPPNLMTGPGGGPERSEKSIPGGPTAAPMPDTRFMINIDLLKLTRLGKYF